MPPASAFVPREGPSGLLPSSRCFKISKRFSFTYGIDSFETTALVLGPRAGECVSYSSYGSPGCKSLLFSKPNSLRAHFSRAGSKGWGA